MNLEEIWKEFQAYDGEKSRSFHTNSMKIQFYKGAMEIPLIAFYPNQPFDLNASKMLEFEALLAGQEIEIDCVTEGSNYKINKSEDHQYIGRITNEALKLHAIRIKELGWVIFEKVAGFFIKERV